MPWLLGSLLWVALAGCEKMEFARYSGENKAWPTGSSFTDAVHSLPVFRGWPEKPYDVLGYVQFNKPNVDWNQGDIKQAAALAKQTGGDAILLVPRGNPPTPSLSAMCSDIKAPSDRTFAVVLKWK